MGFFWGLFGVIDILAAAALLGIFFDYPIPHLQAGMALGLIGKGLIFINDILSIMDICIGIMMFAFFWWHAPNLALIFAIWLLYKGLYAWF